MNNINISEIFGSMVFNDRVMKERLPEEVYLSVINCRDGCSSLSVKDAKVVASAMKDWAIEKGATHFTHWFQPLTGITAEKHDGFIEVGEKGMAITKFSEKSLVKGESDASSFPNGGLRATFEARGYTVWDPTSYAFVKDGSLYIPTAFCSYGGEALDKKTPLLRSMEAISKEAVRLLKLFGMNDVKRVIPTAGAEQEYFLIDKSVFEKRLDLIYSGRTLYGSSASKGQELDDHYCGAIKPRVASFMKELDVELWKLGVYAKTKHNEAAPSQYELAPIFTSANIASDHNQLTMEMMKSVASRHGLVCLLAEKPFASVSGSGKHNNWSLSTDTGINLFEPGKNAEDNLRFLLFVTAVVNAVDNYQDLLRLSVASAGNDVRLGKTEAPPAIISVFLGEYLEKIFDSIEKGETNMPCAFADLGEVKTGASVLPALSKDDSDRNRTSPFAFTGNKFEFRMVGSSQNISCPNFIINTIVAEELSNLADKLENEKDVKKKALELIRENIRKHKRIMFSGNNYSTKWKEEAERRGLSNLATTADALPKFLDEKNVSVFERRKVLSRNEIASRTEALLDNYVKTICIEVTTAIKMAKKQIIPAIFGYKKFIDKSLKTQAKKSDKGYKLERTILDKLCKSSDDFADRLFELEERFDNMDKKASSTEKANYCKNYLIPAMKNLREVYDYIEELLGDEFSPFPNYDSILYSI